MPIVFSQANLLNSGKAFLSEEWRYMKPAKKKSKNMYTLG